MAERLPVGSRNIKIPLSTLSSSLASNDVSNATIDRLTVQTCQDPETNGSNNNQLLSNGSNTASNRNLGNNKQAHLDGATRNGSRTKEGDSRNDEWVEQDEPGVYITLTSLPGGVKDLKRVRFRYVAYYLLSTQTFDKTKLRI